MLCGKMSLRGPARWRILLAVCCIALVIFGGVLEVAHSHSPNDMNHAGCAFCATAHLATRASAPITAPARTRQVTAIVAEIAFVTVRRFSYFSLCIRPPPVVSAAA